MSKEPTFFGVPCNGPDEGIAKQADNVAEAFTLLAQVFRESIEAQQALAALSTVSDSVPDAPRVVKLFAVALEKEQKPDVPESCSNCRFWFGDISMSPRGLCRHNAPRPGETLFAEVSHENWCGEYEEKTG